jgi:hypothetical protein
MENFGLTYYPGFYEWVVLFGDYLAFERALPDQNEVAAKKRYIIKVPWFIHR